MKHKADHMQKVLTELQKRKDHSGRILRTEVERVWTYFQASLKYSIGGYKMDIGEEGLLIVLLSDCYDLLVCFLINFF